MNTLLKNSTGTKVGIKPDKKTMGSIDYLYNKLLLKIK